MKLDKLDGSLIQIIESSIKTSDTRLLLDCCNTGSFSPKKLDSVVLKLGEDISVLCRNLSEKEDFIQRTLLVLTDLIKACEISETVSLFLARTVLLLIIEENCSICTVKRATHVFSLLLNNSTIEKILNDESLEGSLQILGRKISGIGDFECQALIIEVLYRITTDENRGHWTNIWFTDTKARSMFLYLDPNKFEYNCRKVLNYINSNEIERRVFSFLIYSAYFGSFKLKKPHGCDFWVDFNYDSKSISFYCSELNGDTSLEDSSQWETILIDSPSVKSYLIKDKQDEKLKELTLILNVPCHSLITLSNSTNPSFDSCEIRLTFWAISDIHQHLERVYSKDKCINKAFPGSSKLSHLSGDNIDNGCNVQSNGIFSHSKVSDSIPFSADAIEYEDFVPGTEISEKGKRISRTAEVIKISYEDFASGTEINHKGKRVFQTSKVIGISSEDFVPGTEVNRKIKRMSQTSELIRFSFVVENVTKDHTVAEELNKSSKETNYSETVSKSQHKKVRLYNLDSAPVYDVPPFSNTNQVPTEKTILKENDCHISDEDLEDMAEETLNNDELNIRKTTETKDHASRKRSLSEVEENNQSIAQKKSIQIYDDIQGSDDEFEPHAKRDSRGRKGYMAGVPKYRQNSTTKRQYDNSQSHNSKIDHTKRSARAPRKAAVTTTRKSKQMLDSANEVTYDRNEVLNENHVPKNTRHLSEKKGKNSNVYNYLLTDTETGSSEVSWLKQKKSCPLFETPKKSYSEWRKSHPKKRKLPIKVVPDMKSFSREPSTKRRKKNVKDDPIVYSGNNRNVKNDLTIYSGRKTKSPGWTDLEKFDLTVEKDTNKNSFRILKEFESDFQSISTSSRIKHLQTSSKLDTSEQNSNLRNNMLQKDALNEDNIQLAHSEENVDCTNLSENTQIDNPNNEQINKNPSFCKSDDISEINCASVKKLNRINLLQARENVVGKNIPHLSGQVTPVVQSEELIHRDEETGCEKGVQSENEFYTKIEANDDFVQESDEAEMKGKQLILHRFLKSVAKRCKDSMESLNVETQTTTDMNPSDLSNNSFSNKSVSRKSLSKRKLNSVSHSDVSKTEKGSIIVYYDENAEKETEYADNNEINLQDQSREIIKNINMEIKKGSKLTGFESSSLSKAKKQKSLPILEDSDKNKKNSVKPKNSKNSKDFKKNGIDSSCSKMTSECVFSPRSPNNVGTHDSVSEKLIEFKKVRKENKQNEKFKGFSDDSFNSLQSNVTTAPMQEIGHDKEWFDKITFVLSQDADTLTRKLLATVQKCFCDYSSKMISLRENIVKTAEAFEASDSGSDQNSVCKMKNFIKSCRLIRSKVDKSLKQMHMMGKEYFAAEERFLRKLQKKHMKASKKYILNMKRSEKNAVHKLEHKVLLKTKWLLKNFVKHIDSA